MSSMRARMASGVRWGNGRRSAAALIGTIAAVLGLAIAPASGTHSVLSGIEGDGSPGVATSTVVETSGVPQSVIVRADDGQTDAARAAVSAAGGTVGVDLSIINGFAATVPADRVDDVAAAGGVASVTPDAVTTLASATYTPGTDGGSPVGVSTTMGANRYWVSGFTGRGVGVALIDSGVVPVDGLQTPGKVWYGPDFTPDGQVTANRGLDMYGHGTFMAGLIAGRSNDAATPLSAGTATYLGVAPDARLISLKVADSNGNTAESAVIAAIQWVVQHRDDPKLNIRVLNLALSVPTSTPYTQDPLAAAAEQAWKAGIVVVAAAGNGGTSGLSSPAYDPYLLAVGAIDTNATLSVADDSVADFSQTGNGTRGPDLATLGTHIVSLRNPGSYVDRLYGGGAGSVTTTLMRGSGTSEATAITSGAVALLLQQRPGLTPDQVKALLVGNTMRLASLTTTGAGAGALNASYVFQAATPSGAAQNFASAASGAGPAANAASNPATTAQSSSVWLGLPYTDTTVTATGSRWSGSRWSNTDWSGSRWSGSRWSGSRWSGSRWSDVVWTNNSWR